MNRFLIPAMIGLLATASYARANVTLGAPSFTGDGCPEGTATVALSPDSATISILFDGFIAESGGDTGLPQQRKTCVASIPASVAPGFQAAITQVDYRGFQGLPAFGISQFTVEYAFEGTTQPRITRRWRGPMTQDFTTVNRLRRNDIQWTACGAQTALNLNASIITVTNAQREQSMSSIDSTDLASGGISYQIQYRRCR